MQSATPSAPPPLSTSASVATPTIAAAEPTTTPVPQPTIAPTVNQVPPPTAKPTVALAHVDLTVLGIMSVEDLNTLMLDIRALPGIENVQGGAALVQVDFDPGKVTRKQITDLITSRGYVVKE